MQKSRDIEVLKSVDSISLIYKDGDTVLDEQVLSMDLARSLRSALEVVISGRRKSAIATTRKKGMQLQPVEAVSPLPHIRPEENARRYSN